MKKIGGKTKITNISAKNKQTPLAKTEEESNKLITNDKLWSDVYGVKPYEYLELVIDGKVPFFDKTTMQWVEKKEKVEDTTDEETENEYVSPSEESDESDENTDTTDNTSNQGQEDLPF